jgi:hypothetical protein
MNMDRPLSIAVRRFVVTVCVLSQGVFLREPAACIVVNGEPFHAF